MGIEKHGVAALFQGASVFYFCRDSLIFSFLDGLLNPV